MPNKQKIGVLSPNFNLNLFIMKQNKPYLNYLCLFIFSMLFSQFIFGQAFVTTWLVEPNDLTITIPTTGSGYKYTVDWGDGTSDTNVTGNISHTYPATGNTSDSYSVSITGDFPRIYFNNDNAGNNLNQITAINSWGNIEWSSMAHAFEGSNANLHLPTDSPDLSKVTDMSFMFRECNRLLDSNASMNNWDVSNVTNMESILEFSDYRGSLRNWDVSNVTNMKRMFVGCVNFNRDLSLWDVSKVKNMSQMFLRASAFNTNISNWDVSNVTDMSQMFDRASAFDQNIGSWNVSLVTDMSNMFRGAGLSTSNYDALLIGWNNLTSLQNGVIFDAGTSSYSCSTAAFRSNIINTYSWNISDGGIFNDTTLPTVVTENITIQLDSSGNATILPSDIENGSTDDCQIDLSTASLDKSSFTCTDIGTNTVTLSVSDISGNIGSSTAIVTVEAFPNTVIRAISKTTTIVQLDANGQATITPQDVDGGSTTNGCNLTLSIDKNSFDCSNLGVNSVTLTASDGTFSDSDPALVIVEDNLAPIVITRDINITLDPSTEFIIPSNINNGSTDNCGIASITLDKSNFSCADIGANTVTLTVTDINGNVASETATVFVSDRDIPNVIAQDITVQLDASGNVNISTQDIDNGSSDNCFIDTLMLDQTDFNCSNLGVNTVTLTVTDGSGNVGTTTAQVTVVDNTNVCPSLSIKENISNKTTVLLYPNPTSTSFSIETNKIIEHIDVYSLQGKIVKSFDTQLSNYNIEELNSGIYFVKIKSDNDVFTKKIIKE